MKLKKLKISELTNYRHLTNQEMQQHIGGYRYDDKSCFFNCMEYFAKEICGNQSLDCEYFDEAYFNGNDIFPGTHNFYEYTQGPQIQKDNGEINLDPFVFFSAYFNLEGSGWQKDEGIQSLFINGSVENTAVMGIFMLNETSLHCAILQEYDAATDTYTYYDPSCSNEKERVKTVDASQVIFAARAGCK